MAKTLVDKYVTMANNLDNLSLEMEESIQLALSTCSSAMRNAAALCWSMVEELQSKEFGEEETKGEER